MVDSPNDPLLGVRRDVVEGVRAMLDTFGANDEVPEPGRAPGRLPSSIEKLRAGPPDFTTYFLLAFASATIRWASNQTGRDEGEILDEIGRGFEVT